MRAKKFAYLHDSIHISVSIMIKQYTVRDGEAYGECSVYGMVVV